MAEKENRFAVIIPTKDFMKLGYEDRAAIGRALDNIERLRIQEKRPGFLKNNYIVCNQDEPYAEAVWQLILVGEDWKKGKEIPETLEEVFRRGDWKSLCQPDENEPTAGAGEVFMVADALQKMTKAQIMDFVANNPETFNPDDFVLDAAMKKGEMIRAINEYLESPF